MKDKYFETILCDAIRKCEGYIFDNNTNGFGNIYPFTTENINGYIPLFDLKNKSLLTVGSSSDHVINAVLNGCCDITVLDINPYTKFYYYLKKCALMTLDYNEFFNFFCYNDYPKVFKKNKNVFDKKTFEDMKDLLRLLDYESYLFWDELFQMFDSKTIREYLFSGDEDRSTMLKQMNAYLKDETAYNETKNKIKTINPKFITTDITKIDISDIEGNFDNIFLSNIGMYISIEELKKLIEKLSNNLNIGGMVGICYLYRTVRDTKYDPFWAEIYNLDKVFSVFDNYISDFRSFIGVSGIKFEDQDMKDSIMIYKKDKL